MKLKTLKDFEAWDYGDGPLIDYTELRQSAIEWIKSKKEMDFMTLIPITPEGTPLQEEKYLGLTEVTLEWIKHFFNLTEEDLKK